MFAPRAQAAWRLHDLVSAVADYGLCMAGPTGAMAMRDDSSRFRLLARRRLVTAAADDKPFARCGALGVRISGRSELGGAYQRLASDFIEWGGGGQQQSLNELLGVIPDLVSLHAASWPFGRKPLNELLRPSRGAFEAVHPMEPARPEPVRGLVVDAAVTRSTVENAKGRFIVLSNARDVWALRSRDHGQSWTPTSAWQSSLEGFAHHCVADEAGTRFSLAPTRNGEPPGVLLGAISAVGTTTRQFGVPGDIVIRMACDSSGAVVLTQRRTDAARRGDGMRTDAAQRGIDGSYHVFACPIGTACREIPLPPQAHLRDVSIDVARVARTVVIALSKDGLVRVTTSRDEGASMTPLSLVFDSREVRMPGLDGPVVPTLLGFEKHLELSFATPGSSARWALRSVDFGASFRGRSG